MANVPIKLESLIDVGNVMVRALSEKELILDPLTYPHCMQTLLLKTYCYCIKINNITFIYIIMN